MFIGLTNDGHLERVLLCEEFITHLYSIELDVDCNSFKNRFKSKYQLASLFYIKILSQWYSYDEMLTLVSCIGFTRRVESLNTVDEMLDIKNISIEPSVDTLDYDLMYRYKRTNAYLRFITEIKQLGEKSNMSHRDPESEIINEFNSLHIKLNDLHEQIDVLLSSATSNRRRQRLFSPLDSISELD